MGEGGWLVTHVISPPEFATEHLRMDVSEIIGGRGGGAVVRLFFSTDWPFRISMKNNCNEKPLKIGVTDVGEIKMRAGKDKTHSKGFPENIIKFLRALNNTLK